MDKILIVIAAVVTVMGYIGWTVCYIRANESIKRWKRDTQYHKEKQEYWHRLWCEEVGNYNEMQERALAAESMYRETLNGGIGDHIMD